MVAFIFASAPWSRKTLTSIAGVAAMLSAFAASAASNYVATPLSMLGMFGSKYNGVTAINGNGDAAGTFITQSGMTRVFLFADGSYRDLGVPGPSFEVLGLNNQQETVGEILIGIGKFGYGHAYVMAGGVVTDIGTLGGMNSIAYAISDNGTIVGNSEPSNSALNHAFAYANGTMHDLGTLSGGESMALAINARGDITGTSASSGISHEGRAFLFTNGAMHDIGTLGGAYASGAAISNSGAVTGTSTLAGDSTSHAFLYTNGAMQDLGALDGYSEGVGVNSGGDVVGNSGVSHVNPKRAFLYTSGAMHDLNDLVASGLGAATLLEATAINDFGQIVAVGCTPGFCQSFGLNPVVAQPTAPVITVVEYYLAQFDHYFITADPTEIALLDAGAFAGWVRTGETFNAYAKPAPGAEQVCRFFSTSFSPKSSHFYSADANECAEASALGDWQFEGYVMYSPFPRNGNCPSGTSNVYRLYNNGQGGAPAHRYTTSSATRMKMIQQGWVPEGYGIVGIAMCSPN